MFFKSYKFRQTTKKKHTLKHLLLQNFDTAIISALKYVSINENDKLVHINFGCHYILLLLVVMDVDNGQIIFMSEYKWYGKNRSRHFKAKKGSGGIGFLVKITC